mmetsp:Transcript_783/g.2073  ORF Transcript_783/g.2073 Transcript_783/m.2073 type:complete len:128 (-) Transcript_783:570-953(-)
MPQLDNFSFFSQVFWVLLFFSTFYFLNIRQILPAISSALKVRSRLTKSTQQVFHKIGPANRINSLVSHIEFFALTKVCVSSSGFFSISPLKLNSTPKISKLFNNKLKNVSIALKASRGFFVLVRKFF